MNAYCDGSASSTRGLLRAPPRPYRPCGQNRLIPSPDAEMLLIRGRHTTRNAESGSSSPRTLPRPFRIPRGACPVGPLPVVAEPCLNHRCISGRSAGAVRLGTRANRDMTSFAQEEV